MLSLGVVLVFILVMMLLPNFMGPSEQARIDVTAALIAKGAAIPLAIEQYRTHIGSYPRQLADLVSKPAQEPDASMWQGPYVNPVAGVLADPWGHPFLYKALCTHDPKSYDLWSAGPDGQDGTGDDIGNW